MNLAGRCKGYTKAGIVKRGWTKSINGKSVLGCPIRKSRRKRR